MAQLIKSDFKPAWWLVSPHLQTLWPSLTRTRPRLDLRMERIDLHDGDFIDLAWHDAEGPLVMLLHGLEGSLDSHYAPTILHALNQAGFSALFMHLRGCSGEPNRLQRSYHSGASDDLQEILQILQKKGCPPQAVVGISLGGNLLLKYLGESGHNSLLQAAVAVSVPFHLAHVVQRLEQGFSRVYGRHLLRKLLSSYRQKCRRLSLSSVEDVAPIRSIFEFDDKITAIQNGFTDAADYYNRCSSSSFLKHITTPTLILHAQDDPFMQPEDVPNIDDLGPGVSLELSSRGGHVGFVHGNLPWRPGYWLDQRIPAFLKDRLA
ncbi:MAG: hydrolase [Candidatus Thiodiazotropha sp. (ex Codakia rugifera)]|nr:hydrolase [Candidatus Thiodiazotropha sp. (ex Codakia rugifera)]